jgi:RNA polymerase-binding protein DksA
MRQAKSAKATKPAKKVAPVKAKTKAKAKPAVKAKPKAKAVKAVAKPAVKKPAAKLSKAVSKKVPKPAAKISRPTKAPSLTKKIVSKSFNKPAARKPAKSPFKADELRKARLLLLEEEVRLREELQEIEDRAARAIEMEAAGELSDFEDHPADGASETFEREKDLAIADNIASLLVKIKGALDKIEKKTYGVCDICGQAIKKARMEAMPFATLCIDCQGRVEIG